MKLLKADFDAMPEGMSYTSGPKGAKMWKCMGIDGRWKVCEGGIHPEPLSITIHAHRVTKRDPQPEVEKKPFEAIEDKIVKPVKKKKKRKRAKKGAAK